MRRRPITRDVEPEPDVDAGYRLRWLRRFALLTATDTPDAPELVALRAAVERADDPAAPDLERLAALEDVLAAHGVLEDFTRRVTHLAAQSAQSGATRAAPRRSTQPTRPGGHEHE